MRNIENDNGIEKLSCWDLPDTVQKQNGYDSRALPEATSGNMEIFMAKINELTDAVNSLKKLNEGLIKALK